MKKAAKIWLIVAAALVLCGAILFVCAMAGLDWDFNNLSTENYETKVYEFDEGLQDISVITDTADIEIVALRDMAIDAVKVVCYENSKEPHSVSISDGVLTVKYSDDRQLTDFIGINNDSPKITIYLPQGTWGDYGKLSIKTSTGDIIIPSGLGFDAVEIETSSGDVDNRADVFGSMKIKTSTGDIDIEETFARTVELSTSTGDVSLENVECENELSLSTTTGRTEMEDVSCETFISIGTTGDIIMDKLKAYMQMTIERSAGDVTFSSCESPIVRINTDTGDVRGSFESGMIFNVETDTGDVSVPQSAAGGECDIKTDTGDVRIETED